MAAMRRFEVTSDSFKLIGPVRNLSRVMNVIKYINRISNGCRARNAVFSAWNCLFVLSPQCSWIMKLFFVNLNRTVVEVPKDGTRRLKRLIEGKIN
jgi:hypothetical protein